MKAIEVTDGEYKQIQQMIEFLKKLIMSPHDKGLLEFVTGKELRGKRATDKYLQILSVAIRLKSDASEMILSFPHRGARIEFASTSDEIEQSGKDTSPQKVPRTEIWALTNTRTEVKRDVLRRALLHVGYGKDVAREASETL